MTCEVELLQIIHEVFSRLGISVRVLINNRKILAGVAEAIGEPDKFVDITTAIDKLDKTDIGQVNRELAEKGLKPASIEALQPILLSSGSIEEKLTLLDRFFSNSETGKKGMEEINIVYGYLKDLHFPCPVDLDLKLARGLNYYTGTIIEVKAADVSIGSICGGGRYDDLTGIFGLKGMSGVGVSFGADRIYDVMTELQVFPSSLGTPAKVLFLNFGQQEEKESLLLLARVRKEGIAAELYPDPVKLKKQMEYANKRNIPFVAMIGNEELASGKITLKNMITGAQETISRDDLIKHITE